MISLEYWRRGGKDLFQQAGERQTSDLRYARTVGSKGVIRRYDVIHSPHPVKRDGCPTHRGGGEGPSKVKHDG